MRTITTVPHRSALLSSSIAIALALVAPACGSATTAAATIRSGLARVTPSPDASLADLSAAERAFALDLMHELGKAKPGDNLTFSPSSVHRALLMVLVGARGNTAAELRAVLHVGGPTLADAGVHRAANALDVSLGAIDGKGGPKVSGADSAWGQKSLVFERAFLDTIATQYGAGLETIDFEKDLRCPPDHQCLGQRSHRRAYPRSRARWASHQGYETGSGGCPHARGRRPGL